MQGNGYETPEMYMDDTMSSRAVAMCVPTVVGVVACFGVAVVVWNAGGIWNVVAGAVGAVAAAAAVTVVAVASEC